jgi:D-alanyl-lipoteichoic acid acyltransferase DltB (MBOAT superfamily)
MFLVDSYEELVDRQPPLRYLLFVCFFPYVIMGPLVHWSEVMPQLARPVKPIGANISRGFFLLALGLFKKAVLADAFSKWADAGFAYSGQLAFADAWITSLAYALQLYFDFCGYTDMALGAAWMLNVQLPHNFSSPYKARSIIEFWQRWHITLTNFITTYLYTPIVRSARKVTFTKAMWATVAAMAIAGLWHGAGWTFVIWGVLHGVALVINHIWRKRKWPVPAPAAWALTFGFVVSDLVFFRSANVPQALSVLHSMFLPRTLASYEPFASLGAAEQAIAAIWILFGVAILLVKPTALDLAEGFRPSPVAAAITAACLVVSTLYVNSVAVKPFIYRDF